MDVHRVLGVGQGAGLGLGIRAGIQKGWWEDGSEVAGDELSGVPMGAASWEQPQVQAGRVLGPGRPQEGRE